LRKKKIHKEFRRCVYSLEAVVSSQNIKLENMQKFFLREWQKQAGSYWRYCFMNKNLFFDSYLMIKDFYLSVSDTYCDYMLSALARYLDCILAAENSTLLIQRMIEQDESQCDGSYSFFSSILPVAEITRNKLLSLAENETVDIRLKNHIKANLGNGKKRLRLSPSQNLNLVDLLLHS